MLVEDNVTPRDALEIGLKAAGEIRVVGKGAVEHRLTEPSGVDKN
jgi:hypothetical protein